MAVIQYRTNDRYAKFQLGSKPTATLRRYGHNGMTHQYMGEIETAVRTMGQLIGATDTPFSEN